MDQIIIALAPEMEEAEIVSHFKSLHIDILGELKWALDLFVLDQDIRATVFAVSITEVDLDSNEIHLHYDLDFEVYAGCKDKTYQDTESRVISGKRQKNVFLFDRFVSPEAPSPKDEF